MKPNERIKEIRIRKQFTQAYICKKTGISPSNYSLMERGRKRLYAEEAAAICKVLGVTADFLLFGYDVYRPFDYVFRTFENLEKEDQVTAMNYIEFLRQMRDEMDVHNI